MSDRAVTAERLLTGYAGPLATSDMEPARFSPMLAKLAYVLWLARARASRTLLAGRPGYEADETFRHRVTAAVSSSGSLAEFGDVLFRRLGLSIADLKLDDALWWRQYSVAYAAQWRHCTDSKTLTEAVVGARLLRDWKLAAPTEDEVPDVP